MAHSEQTQKRVFSAPLLQGDFEPLANGFLGHGLMRAEGDHHVEAIDVHIGLELENDGKPGLMRQQVPDLHLLTSMAAELGDQLRDVRGQRELPLLDRPEHQRIGECLGDGKNTEHRVELERPGLRSIGGADGRLQCDRTRTRHLDDRAVI